MIRRKRTVGLITFLKGNTDPAVGMPGCANYDHHHGGCLFCWADCDCTDDECLPCTDFLPYTDCRVEKGQRCHIFERRVLPTSADIGLRALVYSLYEKQVGISTDTEPDIGPTRPCPDCGAPLRPRERYCAECSRERRLASYRKTKKRK